MGNIKKLHQSRDFNTGIFDIVDLRENIEVFDDFQICRQMHVSGGKVEPAFRPSERNAKPSRRKIRAGWRCDQLPVTARGDFARGVWRVLAALPVGFREYARSQPFLSSLGRFPPHDRNVSIGLICNHVPAPCEAGQNCRFSSAL